MILSVGGFLGMGEHYVAVSPSSVRVSYNKDKDTWSAKMNTTKEALKAAPEFQVSEVRSKSLRSFPLRGNERWRMTTPPSTLGEIGKIAQDGGRTFDALVRRFPFLEEHHLHIGPHLRGLAVGG